MTGDRIGKIVAIDKISLRYEDELTHDKH